jgi:hypothetical protein
MDAGGDTIGMSDACGRQHVHVDDAARFVYVPLGY